MFHHKERNRIMASRKEIIFTIILALASTASFSFAETILSPPLGVNGIIGILQMPVNSTLHATGTLDITNNAIKVGYVQYSTSSTPGSWVNGSAVNFQTWLNDAYADGAWMNIGITSLTASKDPNQLTGINWCTGKQYYDMLGISTFHGVTYQPTDILASFGYIGDLNMDGSVDANDVAQLQYGLAIGGTSNAPGTILGDLNYDGHVTSSDANVLNSLVAVHSGRNGNPYGAVLNPSRDITIAPEPSTLALLCIGALGLVVFGRAKSK
jgi:hypothetical protein